MSNVRDAKSLKKLGLRIRSLRQEAGFSMRGLGNEAGIEYNKVYRVEKGIVDPTYSTLLAIDKALKLSVGELVDYK